MIENSIYNVKITRNMYIIQIRDIIYTIIEIYCDIVSYIALQNKKSLKIELVWDYRKCRRFSNPAQIYERHDTPL